MARRQDADTGAAPSSRTLETRRRLIATAEYLFAEIGFDAVSLRQIAAAAGQRNTNVVRYHFGNKERLIEAIFEHRQAELEPIRVAMLAKVPEDAGAEAIDDLLAIIIRPPLLIVDQEERYRYVKLVASYLNRHRDSGVRHPLDYAPELLPTIIAAQTRLFELLDLSRQIFDLRIQMVTGMALHAVIQRRERVVAGLSCPSEEEVVEDVMMMASAAMRAPMWQR